MMRFQAPETDHWLAIEIQRILRSTGAEIIKVLDIGAGDGRVWKSEKISSLLDSRGVLLEIDVMDVSKNLSLFHEVPKDIKFNYVEGLIPKDLYSISGNSYHFVTALDVIEHLPKEDGYRLLYEMDRVSSHGSLVRTPNGFLWQAPFESNPYQAHISGWSGKELRALGWNRQFGEAGLKWLVGAGSLPKFILSNHKFRKSLRLIDTSLIRFGQLALYAFSWMHIEVISIRRSKAFDLEGFVVGTKSPQR